MLNKLKFCAIAVQLFYKPVRTVQVVDQVRVVIEKQDSVVTFFRWWKFYPAKCFPVVIVNELLKSVYNFQLPKLS